MSSPRRSRPRLEVLEGRAVPSATLVKDINPIGSNGSNPGSGTVFADAPLGAVIGSTLFFEAGDGTNGRELWKSDGTAAGTVMVEAIGTGSNSPASLTNVNGMLFFTGSDGHYVDVLWKSDGTAAGTVPIKPGGTASTQNLVNMNGTLFFTADEAENGWVTLGGPGQLLWKSDGTDAGTVPIKVINSTGDAHTDNLTNVNGTLFFTADDDVNGIALWKSDGTAAGTVLVKDVNPTSGNYGVQNDPHIKYMTNVGGRLFFTADDGTHGQELWVSDGTAAGTTLVKDLNPTTISGFPSGSFPRNLTAVNNTLFFTATSNDSTDLWKTDGSAAGTVLVKARAVGGTNVNGSLFFSSYGTTNAVEMWKTDGTAAGTTLVKTLNSAEFTTVNGTTFFSGSDGTTTGSGLWQTDGTAAGTIVVQAFPGDSYYGSGTISTAKDLTNVNGKLFFSAKDSTHGVELWTATPASGPIDTTGASVASTSFTGAATGTFDKITLTFSEAVQASTVNTTNITLAGPGGAIGITGITPVTGSNNTKFDVAFASQNTPGGYTLNVAVGVLDLAGNPLPQAFSATRTLTTGGGGGTPRVVALGQSDGSVKIIDGDTNEVLVASFRPLDANGQLYKSTVAVALGDLDGDGTPELFVGAQKRAGVAALDASKAGKVFVYNAATILATGSVSPSDTITPFAKNFDGTQTYETGFELATGDVNGDGTVDLIAGSRGDVGQISVMSGAAGHPRIGNVVTPFGTNYRGKVAVAAGNFIAETGTQNDEVAAARGNSDSSDPSRTGTSTRVAMFDLVGSSLNPVTLSGAISADGIPSGIQGSGGQVIDRNAFVAPISLTGTGTDLLLFAARDFVSNQNNAQIRVAVYGVGANGAATVQSANGGSYTVGNQVGSYAIARSDIDGDGADSLAMVVDGASAGVLYLAPLTGANLGGLTTSVLTGGVRITSD